MEVTGDLDKKFWWSSGDEIEWSGVQRGSRNNETGRLIKGREKRC
jgi:hypothetical protein